MSQPEDYQTDDESAMTLIKRAAVVTMDDGLGDLPCGDILIVDGVIQEIASQIRHPSAEVIDADGMIAIPGFVDTHRHLWEGLIRSGLPDGTLQDYFQVVNGKFGPAYTPPDVYAGTLLSALGALNAGVTTVLDWAHVQNTPQHTDASVQALRDAGIRAVFGFGMPATKDQGNKYPDDILRLRREEFASDDQLLTLALAAESPEYAPDDVVKRCWAKAREAGARISVHAGMFGVSKPNQIERFGREGLLGPDLTLVHGGAFSPTEWQMIADTGTTVSISTQIELQMGHGPAPIQAALDVGITPSLSVDVETTVPGDFFTQMRATLAHQRGEAFAREHRGEARPALIGVRDVLRMATVAGAEANGLSRKVGSLAVGKQADIVLLQADTINVMPVNDLAGAVVGGMDVGNVHTVLVAGRIKKRDGKLVGVDLPKLCTQVYEARDRVFAKAGVPCACPRHLTRDMTKNSRNL